MKAAKEKPVEVVQPEVAAGKAGLLRTLFGVMIDPGGALKRRLAGTSFAVALGISGLAFALFFLQTGIDRAHEGQIGGAAVAVLGLFGLIYGSLGIAMVGLLGWAGARAMGGSGSAGDAVRAFGLAYSPTLIYTVFGLLFNLLLGWNTAVAFGVTGVLWALGPITSALKEMVGGRTWPATLLATACGLLVLVGWVRIGALL
jgi:hypothetical protein